MMDGMMGNSWMILGMGFVCVLLVVALLLGIAALAKYLFFARPR